VAEQFSGYQGQYVPRERTVEGFKEILSGDLDFIPEQAFYMTGGIEMAKEHAEQMAHEHA
jgi:F-type H+-transporting ATPase subunit beta